MRSARPIALCFFVVAALLQTSTGAFAEPVSTITLGAGSWNVTTTVISKNADNELDFGLFVPPDGESPACGDDSCQAGDTATFEDQSGEVQFYLKDVTCGETFLSTDSTHAEINQ